MLSPCYPPPPCYSKLSPTSHNASHLSCSSLNDIHFSFSIPVMTEHLQSLSTRQDGKPRPIWSWHECYLKGGELVECFDSTLDHMSLTLCSPSSTFGTTARSQDLTFGTNTGAMQNELNPIESHLWTQWHCLELSVNIPWILIVSYTGELPAFSLLLIFKSGYLGVLSNNLAFTGFSISAREELYSAESEMGSNTVYGYSLEIQKGAIAV